MEWHCVGVTRGAVGDGVSFWSIDASVPFKGDKKSGFFCMETPSVFWSLDGKEEMKEVDEEVRSKF